MDLIGRLFDDQVETPSSPIYWILGALFLVLLLVALYVYLRADKRFAGHRLHRRLFKRYAALVGWFSGLGLSSAIFSLLTVPFLSKRLWLVAALVGLGATAGYAAFFYRRRYPEALTTHEEWERRQRYLPRPKSGGRRRRERKR